MDKKSNLTHHEQLRLDYLYKNYHYLNEREQKELAFLKKKSEESSSETYSEIARVEEIEKSEEDFLTSRKEKNPSDLPVYPGRRSRTSSKIDSPRNPILPKFNLGRLKPRKWNLRKIMAWLGILLILTLAGMLFMFVKGLNSTSGTSNAKAAETEVFEGEDTSDGVNILILGTDGRIGQTSSETRTDSIMVLNVGNKDNKIKLVSFMRDTLVHINGVSYEDGVNTYYDQKLNAAFTVGEQNNNKGAELVREMLKDNFDINIKYYAMVDFSTFATAIDTLFPNGVKMNAQFSTVDGVDVSEVEVPDDLNMKDGVVPNQIIKEGEQRMDGRTLLNYARFRKDDEGDFGRTRRQQEVISAVVQQIKDPTKLFTGSEALGKVFALTSTNLPYSFLLTNGLSTITSGQNGVERVTIPENGDWVDAYDMYGGLGLLVDFDKYKEELTKLGLR